MRTWFGVVLNLFFCGVVTAQNLISSNLPIVLIDTQGQTIMDSPKINVQMKIIYNGANQRTRPSDAANVYQGIAGIEFRGSSSQLFPKKAYGFELRDEKGEGREVALLGMPKEEDWILFASYNEKSLLHNALAMKMARDLGMYASRTQHVEVIVNGRYEGVYLLMEKIKRVAGRLNIAKLTDRDNSGDALTGGYIFKIDKPTGSGGSIGWFSKVRSPTLNARVQYLFEYPDFDEITSAQKSYLIAKVDSAEAALNSVNFTDPQVGYRRFYDGLSFAHIFLMNEVSRNVDGYRISTFFHKDRDSKGGKIKAGPAWDYDLAFGNANYCDGNQTYGWSYLFGNVCPGDGLQVPFHWKRMLEDPSFVSELNDEYQRMRKGPWKTDKLMAHIDSLANVLQESQQRNFQRWPVLGQYIWPNPTSIPTTWMGEILELKQWLTQRLAWLDANMPGTITAVEPEVPHEISVEITPNPFTDEAHIHIHTPRPMEVLAEVFDLNGKLITTRFHYLPEQDAVIIIPIQGPSAAYILRVHTPNAVIRKPLIKH
jgi:hypothetical protein